MRKRRGAYSLLELVLVCAVGIVLLAIAYPSLRGLAGGGKGLTGKRGQTAALDGLRGALAQARARAMSDGQAYRFAVVSGKGNYRIAPDSDDFWSGSSAPEKSKTVADSLQEGSCFGDPDSKGSGPNADDRTSLAPDQVDAGSYRTVVTFLPDGTAREDGQITVCTAEARPVLVKIQALTGVVTTQEE